MKFPNLFRFSLTIIIFAILPFIFKGHYWQHILNMILIFTILAISVNLVFGYMGALTFGHISIFAIGAYTSALLSTNFGFSFIAAFLCAGLSGLLTGLVIGYPTLKLAGSYFAMATIGFHKIMEVIFLNWDSVTGGASGVTGIPYPVIFGISFKSEEMFYYLIASVCLIIFILYSNFIKSHQGRTVIAMRDNAIAASSLGVNVELTRIFVFTISAVFAALAGSLYAHLVRYVAPEAFPLSDSVLLLIMVVLGGPGFLKGPIYGAAIIVLANEYLQSLEQYNMLVFGVGIMLLLVVLPSGIAGLYERIKLYVLNKKFNKKYEMELGIEEVK